jgi:hypothetical protein
MSILAMIRKSQWEWRLKRRASEASTVNLTVDEAFDLLWEMKKQGLAPWLNENKEVESALMNRDETKLRDFFKGTTVHGLKVNIIERIS